MPWQIGKPYALPWGGWEEFDNKQREKYPIRFFLFDKIPEEFGHITYRLNRYIWNIKHRICPRHRYHVIKTSLRPGYYDPTTLILYGTMDLVKQFVEGTKDTIAWDGDEHHAAAWAELQEIYDWWVNKYPNREKELPDFPDVDFKWIIGEEAEEHKEEPEVKEWRRVSDLYREAEITWAKQEEEMLTRVIKVREFLWYP